MSGINARESLWECAREALDALTTDAASSVSDQSIDTVSSLDEDVRKALDAGEKYAEALRQITSTPSRDWHLNAKIAREALRV